MNQPVIRIYFEENLENDVYWASFESDIFYGSMSGTEYYKSREDCEKDVKKWFNENMKPGTFVFHDWNE